MKLAIFDFDGTITKKDSFEDFILCSQGGLKTLRGVLATSPALVSYLLGLMPNWQAKQKVFAHFFQGWETGQFNAAAVAYAKEKLPAIVRPAALDRLQWHKREGHRVVVVSASFENYLKPWCDSLGFDLLATRVEVGEGRLTGQFASKNCYGDEKVQRIKAAYRLSDFEFIYAYGDTRGDLPLKTISNEFHYQPFRE